MARFDDEAGRLAALNRYRILDTEAESDFDTITDLMRLIFAVPMAAITLIDRNRQWLKSHPGIDLSETPRHHAICAWTIRQGDVLQVADATLDPRFRDIPYVAGPPRIRSYMGAPLTTPDGYNLGSLCVLDTIPRDYGPPDREVLVNLASLAVSQMEMRLMTGADAQTGAMTRRAFIGAMRDALSRFHAGEPAAALVVFDLDRFRAVNDRFGHPFGDVVLATLAQAIRRTLRRGDRFGRLGGKQFGVLLDEVSPGTAVQMAERLRAAVDECRFPDHPDVRLTASFGVVPCISTLAGAEAWLFRAEALMRLAKSADRNRCVTPTEAAGPMRMH